MGGTITRVRGNARGDARVRKRICARFATDHCPKRGESAESAESAEPVDFGGKIKAHDFGRSRSQEFQTRRASGEA